MRQMRVKSNLGGEAIDSQLSQRVAKKRMKSKDVLEQLTCTDPSDMAESWRHAGRSSAARVVLGFQRFMNQF